MSLCPLPPSLVQPRPSPPACCGADPQVQWSKGKCGHAFYERPCDDKTSSNLTRLRRRSTYPYCARSTHLDGGPGSVWGRMGARPNNVLLLFKLDEASLARVKGAAGRHAGTSPVQAWKGPRSVLECWNDQMRWPRRAADWRDARSALRQRIWGWRLSLGVAGRRLRRNRPPGAEGRGAATQVPTYLGTYLDAY